jgi:hypothetical protein
MLGPLPRSRRCDAAGAARAARPGPQAESSERPLRRRAARMARPARVRMRRRKPWVLARRRLFGWKVRLLTLISVTGRTPVVRECLAGTAGAGRNRKPAKRVTGMRKRPTRPRLRYASAGDRVKPAPPLSPGAGGYQRARTGRATTRRNIAIILCSGGPNLGDQVARAAPGLLASPSAPRLTSPTDCGKACGQPTMATQWPGRDRETDQNSSGV